MDTYLIVVKSPSQSVCPLTRDRWGSSPMTESTRLRWKGVVKVERYVAPVSRYSRQDHCRKITELHFFQDRIHVKALQAQVIQIPPILSVIMTYTQHQDLWQIYGISGFGKTITHLVITHLERYCTPAAIYLFLSKRWCFNVFF